MRVTASTSTTCSANTVNVVFVRLWRIKVDHVAHIWNI